MLNPFDGLNLSGLRSSDYEEVGQFGIDDWDSKVVFGRVKVEEAIERKDV